MGSRKRATGNNVPTSWDDVAEWYLGWVGAAGSKHHRRLAIPAVLDLLNPQPGEAIIDLGAGPGVLAPAIRQARAHYIGIDASERLIDFARHHHGRDGIFHVGDVRRLRMLPNICQGTFDGAVFLLSIQDMEPVDVVIGEAAWALRTGGRVVLLVTHPCFRIPRQSGWGWDDGRKLQYRRVDRYLTPLAVPLNDGATRSFHRPLHVYINALADHGLLIDRMDEITTYKPRQGRAERLADEEFPVFLGLRARKIVE